MSSRRSALLDARPAWRVVPPQASSAGPEAIELAASAGLHLDAWQQAAVTDLLGEDREGFWSATSGAMICPRQNGKGSIIEALELAWLFLFDVELIFHSAHLFATSADAYRRIKFLIQNTPDLDRQVLRYTEAHGQEGIELRSGQRLRFVTRSKSGGRGFPAPVVVLDEAFNLSQQAMAALVPTMAAQNNPFLLLTSSAPIVDPCSDVLRSFMRRSRSGEVQRRCYIEYSARSGDDEATQLRSSNPGYGIRLNDDVIDEERELLTPEAFAGERLGIVDLEPLEAHSVIPAAEWFGCGAVGHEPSGGPVAYALDVDTNKSGEEWCSIAASDGTHIEIVNPLDAGAGLGWVLPMVVKRRDRFTEIGIDPSGPAGKLIAPLENAGVTVRKIKSDEFVQACGQLVDAVMDGSLRHVDQPALNCAVAGAARRDVGDGNWKLSRSRSSVDISPLCAVAIARFMAGGDVETDFFMI